MLVYNIFIIRNGGLTMPKLDNEKNLTQALKTGENLDVALQQFADTIQTNVLAQAELHANDAVALREASQINLTGEEKAYFMAVIDSGEAFAGVDKVVPATVINRVFDNLIKNRPLLSKIDMVNTGLATEWIFSVGVNPAFWGSLCADIKELQDKGFRKVSFSQMKLSAFMPVCKAFLELNSPEWLARYVITVLTESIQVALEEAIVDGTGKEQPVGMRRSLANVTANEHNETVAVDIEKLDVATAGQIMAKISKVNIEGSDIERDIDPSDVILLVNPQTYWKEIFPMYTIQNAQGQYVSNFPLPFEIVQSSAMPESEIVAGLASDYFFGLGMGSKITQSDEVRFIEDERVYMAKLYGNGQPKFDGAFTRYNLKKAVVEG